MSDQHEAVPLLTAGIEDEVTTVPLNTAHARDMLARRYAAPEWALMEEVAPSTGGGTRYADAVAVNLWQSRGHAVHGFEIKVSRSDWLRELKQPEKAESVYVYCDHWWIVAPRGVVKDGELPPTWGLLELRTNCLSPVVNAPKLDALAPTRGFFASLMRRGHESLESVATRRYAKAVTDAHEAAQKRIEERIRASTRDHQRLREQIDEFKAATGIEFGNYRGPRASTIKLAQALERMSHHGAAPFASLLSLADQLQDACNTIRAAVASTDIPSDSSHTAIAKERQS